MKLHGALSYFVEYACTSVCGSALSQLHKSAQNIEWTTLHLLNLASTEQFLMLIWIPLLFSCWPVFVLHMNISLFFWLTSGIFAPSLFLVLSLIVSLHQTINIVNLIWWLPGFYICYQFPLYITLLISLDFRETNFITWDSMRMLPPNTNWWVLNIKLPFNKCWHALQKGLTVKLVLFLIRPRII